jgi:site-specific DNA recombinase
MSRTIVKAKALRCAIYTRKSSEEGLDQSFNSLHAQREACEAYVHSQAGEGWSALAEIYDDGGYSGGDMQRPALQRLMADVDAGHIDVVVVYKVDRLTRSLADFAKIVERFDARGVSFVSVTQAFNTTSSMGRLTLNVLLSFAQFEREVTGERIRDKIKASKQRGMWMGGNTPLGYEAQDRTLVINPAEAATVRHIFQRYLELGSVHALKVEIEAQGIISKRKVSTTGKVRGGVPLGRGALFHLLSNRVYLGEIPHKGETYPGQHPAIVEKAVFEEVQARLSSNAGDKRRAALGLSARTPAAPLAGRVFDDAGYPMSPTTAHRKGGARYRYYVSSAAQKGEASKAGSLQRAPAAELEALVMERLERLAAAGPNTADWARARSILKRVEVSARSVALVLDQEGIGASLVEMRHGLAGGEELQATKDGLRLTVPVTLKRSGGMKVLAGADGAPVIKRVSIDPALLKALVRAESWTARLASGEAKTLDAIAKSEGLAPAYAQRVARLAFLSPRLKWAIINGEALEGLTLERLMKGAIPLAWSEQERLATP